MRTFTRLSKVMERGTFERTHPLFLKLLEVGLPEGLLDVARRAPVFFDSMRVSEGHPLVLAQFWFFAEEMTATNVYVPKGKLSHGPMPAAIKEEAEEKERLLVRSAMAAKRHIFSGVKVLCVRYILEHTTPLIPLVVGNVFSSFELFQFAQGMRSIAQLQAEAAEPEVLMRFGFLPDCLALKNWVLQ